MGLERWLSTVPGLEELMGLERWLCTVPGLGRAHGAREMTQYFRELSVLLEDLSLVRSIATRRSSLPVTDAFFWLWLEIWGWRIEGWVEEWYPCMLGMHSHIPTKRDRAWVKVAVWLCGPWGLHTWIEYEWNWEMQWWEMRLEVALDKHHGPFPDSHWRDFVVVVLLLFVFK